MDSLTIRTGEVSLRILNEAGEERGIFRFNPEDIESARRLIALQDEFNAKQEEYSQRAKECTTAEQRVELFSETISYLKGLIDNCFGEGSSKILFGDACSLSMFNDFVDGITPYYERASKKRMSKYAKNAGNK